MTEEKAGTKILDEIFDKLDLKALIDTAIFTALTKEAKDGLVKGVLEYLSSTDPHSYGSTTRLQEAFQIAIRTPIQEVMTKIIKEDTQVMAEIERCIREATQKFIGMDKQNLIQDLTSKMHKAFETKDY